jgi:hypothetical protein
MTMLRTIAIAFAFLFTAPFLLAGDNDLTAAERRDGWRLLFDGKTLDQWMTSSGQPSRRPVEQGSINPHDAGAYMLVHEEQWENFILSVDFRIAPKCNSGIFVRTSPLTARPGKDVGWNGIEIAIDDSTGVGYHDTGAIYDLAKPRKQAMKLAGEWNHIVIRCDRSIIAVNLNGEDVNRIDLDQFAQPNRRPDGTEHKFDHAFKERPRKGYIGLQDHGGECWYKNIKLKPLP